MVKMKISKKRLREIIKEELINELGFDVSSINLGTPSGIETSKSKSPTDYKGYSSKEAKKVIDKELKDWAKGLRKVQGKVVKSWMQKAKSGVIDYFDLVRGLQTGDSKRAYPYETDFLMKVLEKDKIIDRFRKYFGGKKGKTRK